MRLPPRLQSVLGTALLLFLPACVASEPWQGPVDECPVCRVEGDLACVEVHVTEETPACTCDGATFHFCSEDCRERFLADPARYAGR
jgi:YHS domain-containing protein